MSLNQKDRSSIKLCLAICAHDGLISETELDVLRIAYKKKLGISDDTFSEVVDEYFESDTNLEQLFASALPLTNELEIAEAAASSDGLDIRENIALQKCRALLMEG